MKSKKTSAPSFRVGIVGCGAIAGGYDLALKNGSVMTHAGAAAKVPGFTLVAVFDPDAAQLRAFSQAWKPQKALSSFQSFLQLPANSLDLVAICSPNETHFSVLKDVATQLRPRLILCEKPLALSAKEGTDMIEICQKTGSALAVNYIRRWDPTLATIGSWIAEGRFGTARSCTVRYAKGLLHNGSHALNLLGHWFGWNVDGVKVWKNLPWSGTDRAVSFHLGLPQCPSVTFEHTDDTDYNLFEIDLFFENARIRLPGGGRSVEIQERVPSPLFPGTHVLKEPPTSIAGTLGRIMEFVYEDARAFLSEGRPMRMSAAEALDTLKICEKIASEGRKQ